MKYYCTNHQDDIPFIEVFINDNVWFTVDYFYDTDVFVHKNGYLHEYNLNKNISALNDDELFQMSTATDIPIDLKIIRKAHKQFSTIIKANTSLYPFILEVKD